MGRGLQPEVAAAARSSASTMAAAVFRSFGPPSVLQLVRAAGLLAILRCWLLRPRPSTHVHCCIVN